MSEVEHAVCAIETIYGSSLLHDFSFGPNEQDNILCVQVGEVGAGPTMVRVQSACYTGEIFRSKDCDCHEQLDESMRAIHQNGGLFVYMLADGRGAGLLTKIRGLALGETNGLDTYDAYVELGSPPDPREYVRVAEVLKLVGVQSIRLLTNNPRKLSGLRDGGFRVEHSPLQIPATPNSVAYLEAKRLKFDHLLPPAQVNENKSKL